MKRFIPILILIAALLFTACAEQRTNETVYGSWTEVEYLDDFGDPTGSTYFRTVAEGTFSNTAVKDASLTAVIGYDVQSGAFIFRMLEYGSSAAVYTGLDTPTLRYKVDGTVYQHMLGSSAPNSDLFLNDKAEALLLLAKDGTNTLAEYTRLINGELTEEESGFRELQRFLFTQPELRCIIDIGSSSYHFTFSCDGVCEYTYDRATALERSGSFSAARELYLRLGDYRDSADRAEACVLSELQSEFDAACALMEAGSYQEAINAFRKLSEHPESEAMIKECERRKKQAAYDEALALMGSGDYEKAASAFKRLGSFSDAEAKAQECNDLRYRPDYDAAAALEADGRYKEAADAFHRLGTYADSKQCAQRCLTELAEATEAEYQSYVTLLDSGDIEGARAGFTAMSGYKDADTLLIECDYREALALLEAGDYAAAQAAFEALGDYSDSAAQIPECIYRSAAAHVSAQDYAAAAQEYETIPQYRDVAERIAADPALADAVRDLRLAIGGHVLFGSYPQTASGEEAPIEWVIIGREDDTLTLLSLYALDQVPWNKKVSSNLGWSKCSLHKWLDDTFRKKAFSKAEQKLLVKTTVKGTYGSETDDRVWLLSEDEARAFEWNHLRELLRCLPTEYAQSRGTWACKGASIPGTCLWWTRNSYLSLARVVDTEGDTTALFGMANDYAGVRPAVRVDMTAESFKELVTCIRVEQ